MSHIVLVFPGPFSTYPLQLTPCQMSPFINKLVALAWEQSGDGDGAHAVLGHGELGLHLHAEHPAHLLVGLLYLDGGNDEIVHHEDGVEKK